MADIARAEASKDGHIASTIIFPNGTQVIRQLPLLDRDGDDITFGEIKKKLLAEMEPGLNPENYKLKFEEEDNVMPDNGYILDYQEQLLRNKPPTFTFQGR